MNRNISTKVKVYYETESGDQLRCEYIRIETPGFTSGLPEDCYPDEVENDDPKYFLNDKEVELDTLPDDIETIADAMYYNSDRFSTKEVPYYGE